VSDITYIPTGEGWLYCAIVKDLFTKKVVGYAASERINTQLCLDALYMAIRRQKPNSGVIFHSDRGIQYASSAFRNALNAYGFNQSMSRKGDPYDNAVAENFFSCLKCECVYLRYFATRNDAKIAVFHYVEAFYNRIRPHSGIGWLTPVAFEKMLTDGKSDVKMVA
jgi:transposase InsO family protein